MPVKTGVVAVVIAWLVLSMTADGQSPALPNKGLTAVPGIRVGHSTLPNGLSGCTVVLADGSGAIGGVAQRGGAPGTRETDLLDPGNLVERVNAIVLSGGSAFGLDAAQGAVRFLEEKGIGFRTAAGVVPIVPAAILFDLGFGGGKERPTADCGYRAASAATNATVAEGNVGAGAGATVGKFGGGLPMKAGIGSAAIVLSNGLVVGAIVAVNAAGDVIDPATGAVVAGARDRDGKLLDVRQLVRARAESISRPAENTTIGVVATNAVLTKAQAGRIAAMADDGLARALYPSHMLEDGDTVFALATGSWNGAVNVSVIGALAADVMSEAIVRAAVMARRAGTLPSAADIGTIPARFK